MSESLDTSKLTFSQAQGYEELPQPLRLEELSYEARVGIWNALYSHVIDTRRLGVYIGQPWTSILTHLHTDHLLMPLDDLSLTTDSITQSYKSMILNESTFNELFDLLQEILRHYACPDSFVERVASVFRRSRLAYVIDTSDPISIIPAITEEEGQVIIASIHQLQADGLAGAAAHLREASQSINQSNWSGSIRESIHAVESVARLLDPQASKSLGPALASLELQGDLHPALKGAFSKLYGYTSDEEGIRHALLESDQAKPGIDEAVFMLGSCAAFASYLARKHSEAKN